MLRLPQIRFPMLLVFSLVLPVRLPAQSIRPVEPKFGRIVGTVVDANGDPVSNSTVTLKSSDVGDLRTLVTRENGFFEFHDIKAGVPYEVSVSAPDFADWVSPTMRLEPGQFKILTGIQLRIRTEVTQVEVTDDPAKTAADQLTNEEQQRIFGFIPNFYVTYETDPAPLTAKMKFQLALKISTDPATAAGIVLVSAAKQAGNTPNYGQGWGAYGDRFGATAADGLTDIMIGGAVLPSLLRQDPRYFYQGTGTTSSRMRHAIFSAFVAKGDNGKWQPNYSTVGGDLAAAGIADLYFPQSNRGVGLVFGNFALGTAERIGANVGGEFLFGRFTHRGGHLK
jgi:Carboxypeptidase regulatory-like domain